MGIKKIGAAAAALIGKSEKTDGTARAKAAGHHGAGAVGLDARNIASQTKPSQRELVSIQDDLAGHDDEVSFSQYPSAVALLKTQIDMLGNPEENHDLGLLIAFFKVKITLIQKRPQQGVVLSEKDAALAAANLEKVTTKINAWFEAH